MAKEILMPKMGMTMETGTVIDWFAKEGDTVERGDVLLEIETDKASLEVEALESGTLLKILVPAGETVPVLDCIGLIGEPGEAGDDYLSSGSDPKATQTKPAAETTEATTEGQAAPSLPGNGLRSTPAAKKLAREHHLNLADIPPNAGGIITEQEVMVFLAKNDRKATPVAQKMAAALGIPLSDIPSSGRIHKEDVISHANNNTTQHDAPLDYMEQTKMQRVAAGLLTKVWTTMPMVTDCVEVDMTETVKLVDWLNSRFSKTAQKFSVTDILIKTLGQVIQQNPFANVYLEDGGRLRKLDGIHIGLGVDSPSGLIVPALRNVDQKSIMEINREKHELIEKAFSGKLGPNDMGNASTTLTNVGAYRMEIFTPLINYPECCIFGTGTIKKKPVVRDDEIVIRPMMWLNYTYDHRVLDGGMAAKMINTARNILEMPGLFMGYEVRGR